MLVQVFHKDVAEEDHELVCEAKFQDVESLIDGEEHELEIQLVQGWVPVWGSRSSLGAGVLSLVLPGQILNQSCSLAVLHPCRVEARPVVETCMIGTVCVGP